MRREDKKKLTINRRIIVNHLIDLEGVLDYLISKQIFTPAIRERIVYESRVPSDRIRHMLDYLVTRNALAYQYFLESLILTGNVHIANVLEPDYSTSEQCRRLIEREMIHQAATTTSTKASSSSAGEQQQSGGDEYNTLQYPTTCSQTHQPPTLPLDYTAANMMMFSHPVYSPLSASSVTGSASAAAGLLDRPNHQQQYLSQHPNMYNQLFSRLPPFHPNHHLAMRRLATYTASPICLASSRSNSSNGSGSSQSMSPVINRVRSSSVTPAIKTSISSQPQQHQRKESQIYSSASATGLVSYSSSSHSSTGDIMTTASTASSMSGNLNSDEMIDSNPVPVETPSSPCSSAQPHQTQPPPNTYDINWNDVNQLELDFVVYKTLPNIRKQLRPNECYQMERKPRGYCLIINNERFYDEHGAERPDLRRYGTDMDASRLTNLFEKLHFVVDVHVDLREAEMLEVVAEFAKRCDSHAAELDAIALILLSHGTDGYVYGVDCENRINLDKDILNTFDEILIGKPKLFIFQACRGEHLNQKDHVQFTLSGKETPERRQTEALIRTGSGYAISPSTSSKSSAPALLQTQTHTQVATQTQSTLVNPNSGEEDNIRRLKQLKLSSLNSNGSVQLMYKKKTNSGTTMTTTTTANSQKIDSSKVKIETVNSSSSKKKSNNNSGVRSRSHSRGKYSAYIVSAASAIRSAMIRTSPCSSCKTISTQTSIENKRDSSITVDCLSFLRIRKCWRPRFRNETISNNEMTTSTSRSTMIDYNIITNNTTSTTTSTTSSYMTSSSNMHRYMDARPIKTMLPSRSDFFIWYSSVRGFVSHRDLDGSPFIKCLTTVFSRCAYELELIEMVRKVNMLMQLYEKKHFDESNAVASYFMVPVAEFHLTKRLYFNP